MWYGTKLGQQKSVLVRKGYYGIHGVHEEGESGEGGGGGGGDLACAPYGDKEYNQAVNISDFNHQSINDC